MTRRRVAAAVLAAALLTSSCTGGDEDEEQPDGASGAGDAFTPAAVELSGPATEEPLRIGVLASFSSPAGEGGDYASTAGPFVAAGAWVARHRYGIGGQEIEFVLRDDRGSAEEAVAAMQHFAEEQVAGVVVLSAGDHLVESLQTAADDELAVLAPYLRTEAELPDGVYVTGPAADQVAGELTARADDLGLGATVVIAAEASQQVAGTGRSIEFTGNVSEAIDAAVEAADAGQADGLILSAPADAMADLAAAAQGRLPDLPLLLTPEAMTPDFADGLAGDDGEGTTAGELSTVGVDASDPTTLVPDSRGDAAAAFFAAQRLALGEGVDDPDLGPLADFAGDADLLSHDAVVALVAAVTEAGTTQPVAVRDALAGLEVTHADGLAGPVLDFSDATAVPDQEVVTLVATTQDPGVRVRSTDDDGVRLFWFALPDGG